MELTRAGALYSTLAVRLTDSSYPRKRLDSVSTHHNPSIPNDSKDHGGESKGDGNGKPSVQLADGYVLPRASEPSKLTLA